MVRHSHLRCFAATAAAALAALRTLQHDGSFHKGEKCRTIHNHESVKQIFIRNISNMKKLEGVFVVLQQRCAVRARAVSHSFAKQTLRLFTETCKAGPFTLHMFETEPKQLDSASTADVTLPQHLVSPWAFPPTCRSGSVDADSLCFGLWSSLPAAFSPADERAPRPLLPTGDWSVRVTWGFPRGSANTEARMRWKKKKKVKSTSTVCIKN